MTQCATQEVKTSNIENKWQWELVFERKREDYLENNSELLRYNFEQELSDIWYVWQLNEIDDWRDTYLDREKQIFIDTYKEEQVNYTDWNNLSTYEKMLVFESRINRDKVNKKSKFNIQFNSPMHFSYDANTWVVSADLYNKEQATELLYEEWKDNEWSDYEDDEDTKDMIDNKTVDVKFWYVRMSWFDEYETRAWELHEIVEVEKLNNRYRPVRYLDK